MSDTPPIEPEGTFDGLRPAAIGLGVAVDIGATLVASLLWVAWLGPDIFSESEQTARAAAEQLQGSETFLLGNLLLGALCTALGAFVGSRRAGTLHVRHGGWIAVASAAFGALMLALEPEAARGSTAPLWLDLFGWILILPAGLLGGALAAAVEPPAEPGPPA